MKSRYDSVYKLVLIFGAWVCFAGTCGSVQPKEYGERDDVVHKYRETQLSSCDHGRRNVGYWHQGVEMVSFETGEVKSQGEAVDATPDEKARKISWKYEAWFEPTKYRVLEGNKWSSWKTPAPGMKFGAFVVTLEAGKWVTKPSGDKFTKGDCDVFAKIPDKTIDGLSP